MMDVKDIKKLYEVLANEGIETIELQNGETKISMTLGRSALKTTATVANTTAVSTLPASGNVPEVIPAVNTAELRSKWIGFFTRINPKTGESYLKLRDMVKKGDILGHVKVLGVLQDLKSEVEGKLKEVLIEEGQPIEYGQPIMRFEK